MLSAETGEETNDEDQMKKFSRDDFEEVHAQTPSSPKQATAAIKKRGMAAIGNDPIYFVCVYI